MLNPARFAEKKCGTPFAVYRTFFIFVRKVIYLKKITADFAVSIMLLTEDKKGSMEKEIRKILLEIIELLEFVGESCWITTLKRLYSDNVSSQKDWLRKIKSLFGGMGSFTDLVLMKNGIICIDENNKLDQLRNRLYNRMSQSFVELNNSEKSQ